MEGEKLFIQSKEIKKENPLLKGPDLIDSTIEREMKSMDFGFSSDNRRYLLQHTADGTRITIECYDSLPDELTPEEKAKFVKTRATREGVKRDVYFLSSAGEIQENEKFSEEPKEYYIAERRDFQTNGFRNFLQNNGNRKILADIISSHTSFDQTRSQEIANSIFDAEQSGNEELKSKNIGLLDRESFEKMKIDVMANIEMPKPAEITPDNLVEYLKSKRILFYTGAGVSKESGVHDMEELKTMLQIDQSQACDGFLKIAANDPKKAAALWEQFTHVAHNNQPTPAHIAMAEIAKQLQCKIFTENVDALHEKTGIQALRPTGDWLKEHIQKEWLRDIDIVITAGLSTDDRGFLAWYKQNNPNGKILAINLEKPRYLGDEDFLLKGDAQEILPAIEKRLSMEDFYEKYFNGASKRVTIENIRESTILPGYSK